MHILLLLLCTRLQRGCEASIKIHKETLILYVQVYLLISVYL